MPTKDINAIVFPFELFGSAGTGAGAQLLGDALREMLDDADEEKRPSRSDAFRGKVEMLEESFDTMESVHHWRLTARALAKSLVPEGPSIWFLGNHLGALPLLEELGPKFKVIQFDAHLDVYNLANCHEELSHGNFLMHGNAKLPSIFNVGSRDLFLADEHVRKYFRDVISAERVAQDPQKTIKKVAAKFAGERKIWIDIDCDVFDPAFFPAVHGTLPFGISPAFLLGLLAQLNWRYVAGVSISEFDPGRDQRDQSLSTLVWLIEWCLLRWTELRDVKRGP